MLWDHRRICGPSLTETSLCGAYLYSTDKALRKPGGVAVRLHYLYPIRNKNTTLRHTVRSNMEIRPRIITVHSIWRHNIRRFTNPPWRYTTHIASVGNGLPTSAICRRVPEIARKQSSSQRGVLWPPYVTARVFTSHATSPTKDLQHIMSVRTCFTWKVVQYKNIYFTSSLQNT